jgi:ABC-type uncharacterized transport system permease subunit
MPKLLKILRGRKSSSAGDHSKKGTSKSSGIFRGGAYHRSGKSTIEKNSKSQVETVIVPTITFSLSEDEVTSDIIHSPASDIENQVHVQELVSGSAVDMTQTIEIAANTETKEIAVGTDDSKTMTFTHLELMRNELAHMMQLAEKDEEILSIRQANEQQQHLYNDMLKTKDEEIAKIRSMLESVEAALAQVQGQLESVNKEHSKAIEVLMKTQYELYELKHRSPSSWMTPVWSFFDMN